MDNKQTNRQSTVMPNNKFSSFGQKFTARSGILQLMDDLGEALESGRDINMLGGGNPAAIPEANAVYQRAFEAAAQDFINSAGNYSGPKGDAAFIAVVGDFLNRHYDWGVTAENIALTNGSQNAFFYLLNLFAGEYPDGSNKKIALPLAPEYVGYADVQVDGSYFVANKPLIEETTYQGKHGFFKYRVDFDALEQTLQSENIGAICCSRPTNPTGNVLTDAEMQRLDALAQQHNVPLIVDNAYGMPFPNILFTPATLTWNKNTILCCSLSKTGLPGLRTGIVVADKPLIDAVASLNAIVNLAPGRLGATIAMPLIANDTLQEVSDKYIRPFYQRKAHYAIELLQKELAGYPVKIHQPEGAIFLWVWFDGLPITTQTLYEELKAAGTLVVPGHYYYPGLKGLNSYRHAHECIRMSVAQADAVLEKGIAMIGAQVRAAYEKSPTGLSV